MTDSKHPDSFLRCNVTTRLGRVRRISHHAINRYQSRHGATYPQAVQALLRLATSGVPNRHAKAGPALQEGTEVVGIGTDPDRGHLVIVTYYQLEGKAKSQFLKDLRGRGRKPGRDRDWANHRRQGKHSRFAPPPTDSLPTPSELEAEMRGEYPRPGP